MFSLPDKIPRRRFFSAIKPGLKSIQNKNAKNKGQAIVEYVLILTVVVTVMGALLLKLNRGIETWAKSLLGKGGYIACLMQTGTLPGKAHSACFMKPIDADFSTSSSSTGGGGGTDSASSTSSASSSSSSSSSSSTGGTDSSSSSTGSGEGGGGYDSPASTDSSASSSSSKSRTGNQNTSSGAGHSPSGDLISLNSGNSLYLEDIGAGEAGAEAGGGSKQKKRKKSSMGFRDGMASSHNRSGRSGRRFRAVQSYGFMSSDQKAQKKRTAPISVSGTISKKSQLRGNNKTSYLVQKKRKKKDKEVKIGKWSFGNIFRIILIICVIVAVVFLIGSQFIQVKKSMK